MRKLLGGLLTILLCSLGSLAFAEGNIMAIPMLYQRPELPQGCEITSLTAVLNYYGEGVNKVEMAEKFLPRKDFYYQNGKFYGPNPFQAYAGNPRRESGWFCYGEPIVVAANTYFQGKNLPFEAENMTGRTREDLLLEVEAGNPVITWVTMGLYSVSYMKKWYFEDSGSMIPVPTNLHCVVLKGNEGNTVHYMDPIYGQKTATADRFFKSYYNLGGHAVVIRPLNGSRRVISQAGDFIQKTDAGFEPLPKSADRNNIGEDWLISLHAIIQNTDFEWVLSPAEDEAIIYADQDVYVFKVNSDEVLINSQPVTLSNQVVRWNGEYYIPYEVVQEWLSLK